MLGLGASGTELTAGTGHSWPGHPLEINLIEGELTDDPLTLAVVPDPLAGETFHLEITGDPTLEELRTHPEDYVDFTCCRPEYNE